MSEDKQTQSPRFRLIRETVTFQIKLMVDGLRDAVLIPVSLIAALVGFLRGGDEPDREFRQVIRLGRRSERWINLFGDDRAEEEEHVDGSIDRFLQQAETAVIEQYRKGRPAENGENPDSGEPEEKP
jgi:hypothetical protein